MPVIKRGLRVVVHDTHYDLVRNGHVLATSETYANKHAAKRAGELLITAMQGSDITLEYWNDQKRSVRRLIRKVFPAKPTVVSIHPREVASRAVELK